MFIKANESSTASWYENGVDLCFRLGKDNNYYEILRYSTDNLIYTSPNINNYAIFI